MDLESQPLERRPPATRRAIRTARLVRFVFYGGAVALGAVALLGPRSADRSTRRLAGPTAQGRVIELVLARDGEVRAFSTELSARCLLGQSYGITWTPADRAPIRFQQNGRVLQAIEQYDRVFPGGIVGHITARIRATLASGAGAASGTLRLTARFTYPEGKHNDCDSGDVRWRAGRRLPRVPPSAAS